MCKISVAPGVIGSFRNKLSKLSEMIVGASGEMNVMPIVIPDWSSASHQSDLHASSP